MNLKYHTQIKFENSDNEFYVGLHERFEEGQLYAFSDKEKRIIHRMDVEGDRQTLYFKMEATPMNVKNVKPIVEGFSKLFLDKLNLLPKSERDIASKRYRHCLSCTLREGNTCNTKRSAPRMSDGAIQNGCGCNLAAKTKSMKSKCPLEKW